MYDGFTRTQGRRAAAQTKQNNYFVDAPEREAAELGKLAALAADYFIALSPTQQNKNFVALKADMCYNVHIKADPSLKMPSDLLQQPRTPINHRRCLFYHIFWFLNKECPVHR